MKLIAISLLAAFLMACGDDNTKSPVVGPNANADADAGTPGDGGRRLDSGASVDAGADNNTSTDAGGNTTDAAESGTDAGGTATDAGGNSTDAGGGASTFACLQGCTTVADCVIPDDPRYDADNFACEDGVCLDQGCNNTAECRAGGSSNVCVTLPGFQFTQCVPPCTTAADCDQGAGAAFDADNYMCSSGACVYTGCNSSDECPDVAPVCHDSGFGISSCLQACETVSDCSSPSAAFDSDNYRCDAGACVYTGCNNDNECMDLREELVCAELTF